MNINGLEAGLPEGFPDVELIERLANQLFQAPPSGTAPGIPDTASLDPLNPLGGTAVPVIGIPGEAELRALLTPSAPKLPETSSVPYYFLEYGVAGPGSVSHLAP